MTEKSFSFDSEISSIEMAENFAVITLQHTSPQIFLLLNMIRILGLLTTPLDRCGIRFGKVIFLSGKAEKLSKYLQIYDRGIMYQRALPINTSQKILAIHLMSGKDTVVMLQDNESDSAYRKGNGAGVVELLSSMTFDNMKNLELSYSFITAVFSDRLSQLMDSSRSLVIDASDLSSDLDDNSIISACYELDKCIVKRICSDIDDFEKCVSKNAEKYQKLIESNSDISDESKKCITYLMVVYHEISRIVKQLNGKFDEKAMIDFLVGVLENFEKIYNGGEVTDEFKMKLNQMISKGEIELVENSSMNNCFGATGKNPIVFIDDDWLYMVKETFDAIMKKIKLASTAVAVKEALNDKGLLKVSENLQYKATLYHSLYSGKINVTAVSADILSNANLKRNRGKADF